MTRNPNNITHELGQDAHREANRQAKGMSVRKKDGTIKSPNRRHTEAADEPQAEAPAQDMAEAAPADTQLQGTGRRVMVCKRGDKYKTALDQILHACKIGNELAPMYAALNIGAFDLAALGDALTHNGEGARRKFMAAATAGIPAALMGAAKEYAAQWDNDFSKAVTKFRFALNDAGLLRYITQNPGTKEFETTPESLRRLADDCAEWLSDPALIEKWETHKEIINLLNKLFEDGTTAPAFWWTFFPTWGGCFTMPDTMPDYGNFIRK